MSTVTLTRKRELKWLSPEKIIQKCPSSAWADEPQSELADELDQSFG